MELHREGFLFLLLQRISYLVREAHIEACEWASIVLHAMWFIPLSIDRHYLNHSPFAKVVVDHLPNGNETVFWITGFMLFYHILTICFGAPPSYFVRREEDQQMWYKLRIVGCILSWLWFGFVAFLFTSVQITAGTILFSAGALSAYVGSHKLYVKMRASWSYLLLNYVRDESYKLQKEGANK